MKPPRKRRIRIVRSRPVLVFYVSRNTTPPSLRVLWRMSKADAMRFCMDPRAAGKNHGFHWTADTGVEGEDWAFVADNGRQHHIIKELGITILESKEIRRD